MNRFNIYLSDQEKKFLKEFASKQYHGAEDNRATATPYHTVQTISNRYIPYSEDIEEYFEEENIKFCIDGDYEVWFDTPEEAVEDYYSSKVSPCNVEIVPYKDIRGEEIKGVDGRDYSINSCEDYFAAYAINNPTLSWVIPEYEDVAIFFILDEAKRYMKYQSHNLKNPRVYTHAPGYANEGDFPVFRELLLKIGNLLLEEE